MPLAGLKHFALSYIAYKYGYTKHVLKRSFVPLPAKGSVVSVVVIKKRSRRTANNCRYSSIAYLNSGIQRTTKHSFSQEKPQKQASKWWANMMDDKGCGQTTETGSARSVRLDCSCCKAYAAAWRRVDVIRNPSSLVTASVHFLDYPTMG